jgi:hypothetical protein
MHQFPPAAYSGAQDFVLALLPWTIVWKLQMRKKEKLGVAFAMSLGILQVLQTLHRRSHILTDLSLQAQAQHP